MTDSLQDLLAKLHEAVGNELLQRIISGEATSADLSVATKFLKDNGINIDVEDSPPIMNLVKSLPFSDDQKESNRPSPKTLVEVFEEDAKKAE